MNTAIIIILAITSYLLLLAVVGGVSDGSQREGRTLLTYLGIILTILFLIVVHV